MSALAEPTLEAPGMPDEPQWTYMAELAFADETPRRLYEFKAHNGLDAWARAKQIAEGHDATLVRLWTEVGE